MVTKAEIDNIINCEPLNEHALKVLEMVLNLANSMSHEILILMIEIIIAEMKEKLYLTKIIKDLYTGE